jgi:hypothetical protein
MDAGAANQVQHALSKFVWFVAVCAASDPFQFPLALLEVAGVVVHLLLQPILNLLNFAPVVAI